MNFSKTFLVLIAIFVLIAGSMTGKSCLPNIPYPFIALFKHAYTFKVNAQENGCSQCWRQLKICQRQLFNLQQQRIGQQASTSAAAAPKAFAAPPQASAPLTTTPSAEGCDECNEMLSSCQESLAKLPI